MTERLSSLPPAHTVVVQFYADVQVDVGRVAVRVEHLVSRQATAKDQLLAATFFALRRWPPPGLPSVGRQRGLWPVS